MSVPGPEFSLSRKLRYVNPLALTQEYVLRAALTQDRSRDGKIDDEYLAASLNSKFAYANFARDLLRVARDSRNFSPWLQGVVIRTGVRHMAFQRNDLTEAQIGRVHHEHRHNVEGGRSQDFVEIFTEQKARWSHHQPKDQVENLTYYGAVDTTAEFFSTIAHEASVHPEILKDTVYNESLKKEISIAKGAKAAINWITSNVLYGPTHHHHNDPIEKGLRSRNLERYIPFYENHILRRADGIKARVDELTRRVKRKPREYLLESQRVNGLGIYFQNITDGGLSTMHSSPGIEGMLGNYHGPIGYVEVQVGAINALEHAARLYPKKALFYKELAQKMRESTMRQFYMPDKKYFAAAVDHDEVFGAYRKVEALSIMGASILNSDLFDNMPDEKKKEMVSPIVERLFSDEFLTDAGLRTKARQHADLIVDPENPSSNTAEYQGSWTVWPALNEDIILGLRRQGFHTLAEQLENRLVNFVHENSNAEYAFVVPGKVWVNGQLKDLTGLVAQNYKTKDEFNTLSDLQKSEVVGKRQIIYLSAPYPQGDQLWTASAVARILDDRAHGRNKTTDHNSWQEDVEDRIFRDSSLKRLPILTADELAREADNDYFFIVDTSRGSAMEDAIRTLSEQKRSQRIHLRRDRN